MRLLLVGSYYRPGPGGAEAVLRDTEAMLRHAGHETVTFACREDTTFASPWREHYPPALDGTSSLWSRAAWRSVYNTQARRRLEALLPSIRPDVAHLHNIYEQLTVSVMDALHHARIPVVVTAHDHRAVCPNYRLLTGDGICRRCVDSGRYWHAVHLRCSEGSFPKSVLAGVESSLSKLRRTYDRVERIIAPSRFLRDVLVSGGLQADRIDVIPNVVDTGPEPRGRTITSPPRFVYFGRYVPEKGLDDLLEASASLGGGGRIELFGAGPLGEHLLDRVRHEDLPVTVHPHASLDEIRPVLRSSVAAVLPARWHENCPMSILEAAAEEVTTISTPMGASRN